MFRVWPVATSKNSLSLGAFGSYRHRCTNAVMMPVASSTTENLVADTPAAVAEVEVELSVVTASEMSDFNLQAIVI